jgi:hypothetical protein
MNGMLNHLVQEKLEYILGSSVFEMCLKAEIACKKDRKGNYSYMECEVFCIK